ncbi:hypothetical protein AR9_g021 [Bacillus phage AR9]|uniref:Uncharacterized protein n=2 Tax=Bacillus phage PBS1 TaxID=10683 RepID=A0A172JHT0_BPPB1|nr:hypothetical protein BI022_gp021 [Bacillus phage AR9]YP_009664407.1 hypothetical protein FK780_gp241 [Bacillus phage PBS1]AMS01106.1 hypothetical protein AR9_g021 [Bacillus phage AR9]ASU00028.1 hypothetical protein PBI_PBS1_206 [Bacillus phage PBS1]BDE75458.1 hypothetical protein [Bacillus phage PBS1]
MKKLNYFSNRNIDDIINESNTSKKIFLSDKEKILMKAGKNPVKINYRKIKKKKRKG